MANEFKVKNGLVVSGSAEIQNDLIVQGTLTAKEIHTSIVTSSVIFESGSTKFGNTNDDTHEFTGSLKISGSFVLNGVAFTAATAGTSGTSGTSGSNGSSGTSGTSGSSGTAGTSGSSGSSGSSGTSGSSWCSSPRSGPRPSRTQPEWRSCSAAPSQRLYSPDR